MSDSYTFGFDDIAFRVRQEFGLGMAAASPHGFMVITGLEAGPMSIEVVRPSRAELERDTAEGFVRLFHERPSWLALRRAMKRAFLSAWFEEVDRGKDQ